MLKVVDGNDEDVVESLDSLLAQQGFFGGGVLDRVRELVTRYAERGARIEDLALKLASTSAPQTPVKKVVQTNDYEVKRLREALESKSKEASQALASARKLRVELAETRRTSLVPVSNEPPNTDQIKRLREALAEKCREVEQAHAATRRVRAELAEEAAKRRSMDKLRTNQDENRLELRKVREALEKKTRESDQANALSRRLRSEIAEADKRRMIAERDLKTAEKKLQKKKEVKPKEEQEEVADEPEVIFEAATGRSPRPNSVADSQALKVAQVGLRHRRRLEDALAALQEEVEVKKIDVRPTVKQWRAAQRKIKDLQTQLEAECERSRGVARERELRKYMGTAALIERDKMHYRLNLYEIDSLPSSTSIAILKKLCADLGVSDVDDLSPSVKKLADAVAALPSLEKFARTIADLAQTEGVSATLDAVKSWKIDLKEKGPVYDKLCAVLQSRNLVESVEEILADNASLRKSLQLFEEAQSFLETSESPESVVGTVVTHVQTLFDIDTIQGIIPKLNAVYLRHAELENFLNDLKRDFEIESESTTLPAIRLYLNDKLK